jgi:hypothetical protein
VAEDVEKVNPDLVVHDQEGKSYTVRYEAVNAMLLNEFLKEHRKMEEQQATIAELKSTVAQQQEGDCPAAEGNGESCCPFPRAGRENPKIERSGRIKSACAANGHKQQVEEFSSATLWLLATPWEFTRVRSARAGPR